MTVQQMQLVVGNGRGVHGRVATRLAEIAAEFDVVIQIRRGDDLVACTSILDVLALSLVQGTAISLLAEGKRSEAALAAASLLIIAQDDPVR